MIGTTAKPTRELPNQLTGMFSIPVSANPTKLMLVVLRTFESSLGSRRMQPIFTPCVRIVESGLASAGLPCTSLVVEIRCRFTRQFMVVFKVSVFAKGRNNLILGVLFLLV